LTTESSLDPGLPLDAFSGRSIIRQRGGELLHLAVTLGAEPTE